MKPRHLLASFGLIVLGMILMARAGAQPTQGEKSDAAQIKDELVSRHQQLARQFEDFRSQLLRLKQRLDKGTPEERARAASLDRLLEQIQKDGLAVQFELISEQIRDSKLTNIPELKNLADRSAGLANRLRDYLEMFREDPRQKQLSEEKEKLKEFLDTVDKILQKEKNNQGLTEAGKTDKNELQKNENKNTEATKKLGADIDKFLGKGDGLSKEAKDLKGGPKDGGKTDEAKAKTKGDGEEGKDVASNQGQAKDGGDEKPGAPPKGDAKGDESASAKDPKASDGGDPQTKEGKNADGSPMADGKAKDGKGSEGAPSEAKSNEGAKGNEADAKNKGDEGAKSGEGQAKGAEKPAGDKPAPSQAKGSEGAKGAEAKDAKGSEGSPSQAKAGDKSSKGGEGSKAQGEAKPGSESKGQGEAKGDGAKGSPSKGGDSQASAKNDSPPSGGGDPSDSPPPPPGGNQKTKDELAKQKKQLQEAGYDMKKAEDNIAANKKKPAVADQQAAIDKLEEMKKNLEKLLRQTREEELERLLAQLEARCRKMLEMQIQVLAGTEQTHKVVLTHADKKPAREDQQSALKLSDQEKDIISEANKAIQMLEEEGSAVAFPEVFQQVREDMKHVQRRLEIADVADVTQAVEKDIIASLQEMIDALKKAQKDLDKQKDGKPPEGQPPPNADQKLLDKIAELKMIRSLQNRINDRTKFYGRLFPNEQAFDPNLRQSLQQLGERQERIFEIMDRFAKGDGK